MFDILSQEIDAKLIVRIYHFKKERFVVNLFLHDFIKIFQDLTLVAFCFIGDRNRIFY